MHIYQLKRLVSLLIYIKISDTKPFTNRTRCMIKRRPFFKWAGSKFNCLQEIIPHLPNGKRLIEPFTGSGVVFLNTAYPSYLLAEGNNDLIYFFTTLQREGEGLIERCRHYFQPKFNCESVYYKHRTRFNSLPLSAEKSALFLYLNRHGYNGLCRYNLKGLYNVPFGKYLKPYFPFQEMQFFYQKSQEVTFIQADFRETFAQAVPGDVIYCDPPYVPLSTTTRPFAYIQKRFEEADQIDLARLARETAAKGIPVIISNHDTEFTRHLYEEANILSFEVSRTISCLGKSRQPIKELLAVFS